jgi:hypothetical protein
LSFEWHFPVGQGGTAVDIPKDLTLLNLQDASGNDEAADPVCVSLFGANAVVLEATDGPNLIEQFRVVQSTAPGKMSTMTPDLGRARMKLKRIRPKKCVFQNSRDALPLQTPRCI